MLALRVQGVLCLFACALHRQCLHFDHCFHALEGCQGLHRQPTRRRRGRAQGCRGCKHSPSVLVLIATQAAQQVEALNQAIANLQVQLQQQREAEAAAREAEATAKAAETAAKEAEAAALQAEEEAKEVMHIVVVLCAHCSI